jgi:peptidoglycan/xylan/chitin deacetylase (PgdA/CDA1 family)
MFKKTSKKRTRKKKANLRILLFFLPVLFIFAITVGVYAWYQSRAIPELNEQNQMTALPPDVGNVLGAITQPQQKTEVALRIPIFLYHYVEYVQNDPGRQKLNIPPNILTAQIETLKKAGYTFVTPDDLALALAGGKKLPVKVAILSFDDGYMDFYTDVFPILQKEQVKAVAYIVPNFLDRPNFMFTFQLKEIAKSPLVEIGAHTMDHYALAGMYAKTATYEVAQSRKTLQEMLHLPINSFAYPYGSFDQSAMKVVKDAGFSNAMSTIPGLVQTPGNKYFLYRLRPGYRSGQVLLDYLKLNTFKPW